jgi:oxalate decarboxylase/phosphoglucose isomerase-like protein (cupin superfamily)
VDRYNIMDFVKLGSVRELSGLKPVLKDAEATGPDPVYWVFSEVTDSKWANITIIAPGDFNKECPKTFGHYHGTDVNETYHLVEGQGVLVMQKKHFDNGNWVEDMVDEVVLVKANPGDEILITPEWGHSWHNTGESPLISFDDWRTGHDPADYAAIERLRGMAYYLVKEDGKINAIPNQNYKNLPEPSWLSATEFRQKYQE